MTPHLNPHQEQHVAQWRASGLSRAAYCRDNDVSYPTFLSWTKQAAENVPSTRPSAFIEVLRPSADLTEHRSPSIASVSLPSGLMLRVSVGTDADWIGRV